MTQQTKDRLIAAGYTGDFSISDLSIFCNKEVPNTDNVCSATLNLIEESLVYYYFLNKIDNND